MEGIYVVGWARKASEGLVGIARHDGEVGAADVLKYLETAPDGKPPSAEQIIEKLKGKGMRLVLKADLECLARAEQKQAQQKGLAWFKYSDDEAMLAAIEAER
jgi:ferredoxin--NADP+ reductase